MNSAKLKFSFLLISVLGGVLFGYGFLKVRKFLENKSQCSNAPIEKLFKDDDKSSCWLKTKPKKIVIIVIDALRIDFALPYPMASKNSSYNKLNILTELSTKNPLTSNLFHFIADPPTATTQRLSGISSGSLPAFVEIAQSFSGFEHSTDNFINQILAGRPSSGSSFHDKFCPLEDGRKRNIFHFFGDDTWLSLFPFLKKDSHCQHSSSKVHGSHSFHLFDLNSVDNDIKENLFPLLKDLDSTKNNEIILAHFLGFDHCGHKYGPLDEKCGEKLSEMDAVIREIIKDLKELNSSSHLIVFGDHGLTDHGDHGGISPKEIGSLLFSLPININNDLIVDDKKEEEEEFWTSFFAAVRKDRLLSLERDGISDQNFFSSQIPTIFSGSIPQINLCPTLSFLAGVPIPFVNIGAIIPELLLDLSLYKDNDSGRMMNMKLLLEAIRINCHQISIFIRESISMNQNGFHSDSIFFINWFKKLNALEGRVVATTRDIDKVFTNSTEEINYYQEIFHQYHNLILDNISHTRIIWADFNINLMIIGISLGFIGIMLFLFTRIGYTHSLIFLSSSFMIIFYFLSLGGTSFITFEGSIVKFVFLSIIGLSIIAGKGGVGMLNFIYLSIILFIGEKIGICREEQFPYCSSLTIGKNFLPLLFIFPPLTYNFFIEHNILLLMQMILYLVFLFISWLERDVFGSLEMGLKFLIIFIGFIFLKNRNCHCRSLDKIFSISILLSLFQRPLQGIYLLCGVPIILEITSSIISVNNNNLRPILAYFLSILFFFSSGHQFTLSSIQWESAFVIYWGKGQIIPAISIFLNTFAGPLICGLWLGYGYDNDSDNDRIMIIINGNGNDDKKKNKDRHKNVENIRNQKLDLFFLSILQTILLEIFCSFLMRHLMVWRLFTPRLIFQAMITLTYLISLLCTI